MNTKHRNIAFTDEVENSNTMSFLDVAVTRSAESFITNVYRKKTFSGVFTNFYSFISIQFKASLISTLLYRCFHLSSTSEIFHREVENLRGILRKNSYPTEFIDQCIAAFLNKIYKTPAPKVEKQTTTVILPFLGKLSLEIRNRLRKYTKKYVKDCDLKIIFRSQRRLKSLFRFKDTLPQCFQSCVLYRFTCRVCNDSYIGKTERHCHVRWCEHLKITPIERRASKNLNKPTAVHNHITSSTHQASLEDFEIIGHERSGIDYFLQIKESLLIKKFKTKLNENVQSIPLKLF